MAKIKQVKMRLGLNPDREYQETVVNICYDSTDRRTETYCRPIPAERFYIKLPQVVADALGVADVRAGDQVEVMKRFEEALEQFKKLEIEVNQVIIYRFGVKPKPTDAPSYFFGGTHEVSVWAGTYEETIAIAGDGVKRYSYELVESNVNFAPDAFQDYMPGPNRSCGGTRFECQVPRTDSNDAFFIWIKERMSELISRLYELEQPSNLLESISAGRLLPLGNSQGK